MPRFSVRDLIWLAVAVTLAAGWTLQIRHSLQLGKSLELSKTKLAALVDTFESFGYKVEVHDAESPASDSLTSSLPFSSRP
jgi:hypothetical protein